MLTLFTFILGIVLITLIARYNESNKLFWALLTCYVLGFAGVKLIHDSFAKDEGKTTFMQVQPTQGLAASSGSLVYLLADDGLPAPKKVTSKPVSQAIVPAYERSFTSSNVPEVTQGYLHVLPNPPNVVGIIDDS